MPLSDKQQHSNETLTEKIEELDSLISNRQTRDEEVPVLNEMASNGHPVNSDIPILDEVVSFEEAVEENMNRQQVEIPGASTDQLLELIDNIEHRLTDELETMVKTIKSNMKESIIDEIKNRLDGSAHKTDVQANRQLLKDNDL